jgi:hypothetical protein
VAEGERRMVFDTRGRRKHVVRVVYAILALLMGASLFLVVGPFNIGNLVGNGSTTSASEILQEQAERTERKLVRDPNNEALLISLTRTRAAAANGLTEVDPETGVTFYTAEGRQELERAVEAWNRYEKLAKVPQPSIVTLASRSYFNLAETAGSLEEASENVKKAAATQRIAAKAQPTINSLTTLAIYEYFAGNFAAGDQAVRQAEAKAPKAQRTEVKKQMATYRKNAEAFEAQRKEVAKQEKSQSKERLQNPLGGLTGGGSLGE